MDIVFDLKSHCIETESKKIYERLIKGYLNKNCPEKEKIFIEQQMEVLKFFLENADFKGLRSHYPDLSENSIKPIIIDLKDSLNDLVMVKDKKRVVLKKETIWKKF